MTTTTTRRKNHRYTEEVFVVAYKAVTMGMSLSKAARLYNIPRSTLEDRVRRGQLEKRSAGQPTALTEEEELRLEAWILSCWRAGFTNFREGAIGDAARLVFKQSQRKTRRVEFARTWLIKFGQRHPRVEEAIKNRWGTHQFDWNFGRAQLETWFERIGAYFAETGLEHVLLQPARLLHCTQATFKPVSVMLSYSAAGLATPPLLVLPTHAEESELMLPKGWKHCAQAEARVDDAVMQHYLESVLHPYLLHVQVDFPVILFVDLRMQAPSIELLDMCRKLQIVLINLHNLAFHKLRRAWKQKLQEWCTKNATPSQADYMEFVELLKDVLVYNLTKRNMRSGFHSSGLFPFGIGNVDTSLLAQDNDTNIAYYTSVVDANAADDVLDERIDESTLNIEVLENHLEQALNICQTAEHQTLNFSDFKALIGTQLVATLEQYEPQPMEERPEEFWALHTIYKHFKAATHDEKLNLEASNDINIFGV